jgi:hypothetical protein
VTVREDKGQSVSPLRYLIGSKALRRMTGGNCLEEELAGEMTTHDIPDCLLP